MEVRQSSKCGRLILPPVFQAFSPQAGARQTPLFPSARRRRRIDDGKCKLSSRKYSWRKQITTFIVLLRKSSHLWINPVRKGYLEAKRMMNMCYVNHGIWEEGPTKQKWTPSGEGGASSSKCRALPGVKFNTNNPIRSAGFVQLGTLS